MTRVIQDILRRYGQSVTVCLAEGEVTVKAFFQPLKERQEQVPELVNSLGGIDRRLWQYLGQTALRAGDRVLWNGRAFQVRSSRPYYIGETCLYWWASLERAKEAAE